MPPQALCLTKKSPLELGSTRLPQQHDLILPRGRDADQVQLKSVGMIFKASPLLCPRPTSGPAASSLPTIAKTEQPRVIHDDDDDGDDDDDDDDAQMTGGSTGSGVSGSSEPKATAPSTLDETKGSPQERTAYTKSTTNCGAVRCSTWTVSSTSFWGSRFSYDHSESAIILCIISRYHIGSRDTNGKGAARTAAFCSTIIETNGSTSSTKCSSQAKGSYKGASSD